MEQVYAVAKWLLPASIAAGGFIVGFLVQRILLSRVKHLIARTDWQLAKTVISALDGVLVLWFGLLGLYIASLLFPLNARVLNLVHDILLVVALGSATWIVSSVAVGSVEIYSLKTRNTQTDGVLPSTSILKNLTRFVIFTIGLLVIANSLGVSVTPLITALGVGGIAVSLALQDTLSNLFAGVHIVASRQVRTGDYIKLESGEEGYVSDINWRNTTIRELSNSSVIVPNSKLSSAIIRNYYMPESELAVLVEVGVSYDSDLDLVERITMHVGDGVMKEVEGGVPSFATFIRYHSFDDYGIKFTVILRTKKFADQFLVKHEFIKRLQRQYLQEGIKMPLPIHIVDIKEPIKYQMTPLRAVV